MPSGDDAKLQLSRRAISITEVVSAFSVSNSFVCWSEWVCVFDLQVSMSKENEWLEQLIRQVESLGGGMECSVVLEF